VTTNLVTKRKNQLIQTKRKEVAILLVVIGIDLLIAVGPQEEDHHQVEVVMTLHLGVIDGLDLVMHVLLIGISLIMIGGKPIADDQGQIVGVGLMSDDVQQVVVKDR